jgi:hypothetical protein
MAMLTWVICEASYMFGGTIILVHFAYNADHLEWPQVLQGQAYRSGRRHSGRGTLSCAFCLYNLNPPCVISPQVGLVAITPACGFVSQMASLLLGILAAVAAYWSVRLMAFSYVVLGYCSSFKHKCYVTIVQRG